MRVTWSCIKHCWQFTFPQHGYSLSRCITVINYCTHAALCMQHGSCVLRILPRIHGSCLLYIPHSNCKPYPGLISLAQTLTAVTLFRSPLQPYSGLRCSLIQAKPCSGFSSALFRPYTVRSPKANRAYSCALLAFYTFPKADCCNSAQ